MIDFSNQFFGETLDTLSIQNVIDYFTEERPESDIIEYKAFSREYGNFNNSIKGVIRAICGLLNSNGGIVLWGAPLGAVNNNGEKIFIGSLAPINDHKEKDWLINKISDSITPLPVGIKVKILEHDGGYVYIFQIQPSPYKPHQFENTYYSRLDGQTKPAPHYFVEALFRKISFPNIEGYIKFDYAKFLYSPQGGLIRFTIVLFNFSKFQNEENLSYNLTVFPGTITSTNSGFFYGKEELLLYGVPMVNSQELYVSIDDLKNNNSKVNFALQIGGKRSPGKISTYTLDLERISETNPNLTSQLITEKKENELFIDLQEKKGSSRESVLKSFLGDQFN